MDATTAKFQQALPYALLPVSQPLAALHASRTASCSTSSADLCSKCGSYLLNSNARLRLSRSKHSRPHTHNRVFLRLCHACGAANNISFRHETPSPSKKRPRGGKVPDEPSFTTSSSSSVPTQPPNVSPIPHTPPTGFKGRSKKKSALQDLLAKNRQKNNTRQSGTKDESNGLAAFLSAL